MKNYLKVFVSDCEGAETIEIVGGIAIAVILVGTLLTVKDAVSDKVDAVKNEVTNMGIGSSSSSGV